jgi:hypothetical protein
MNKLTNIIRPDDTTHFSVWANRKGITYYKDLDTSVPKFKSPSKPEWRDTNTEIFNGNIIHSVSQWDDVFTSMDSEKLWDGVGLPMVGEWFWHDATKVVAVAFTHGMLLTVDEENRPYDLSPVYSDMSPILTEVEELVNHFNIDYEAAEAIIDAGYRK